jgi:hypothetical protein
MRLKIVIQKKPWNHKKEDFSRTTPEMIKHRTTNQKAANTIQLQHKSPYKFELVKDGC